MKPDRPSLDATLPHVLAAPRDESRIEYLCYRPNFGERAFVDRLKVTSAGGVENCRWTKHPWMKLEDGSPDPRIQVCIIPRRVLDLVWKDGDDVVHPGDTFVADIETSEENMPAGTLLKSGDVVLRVSDVWNDACTKWKARYGVDALNWVRDRPELRLRGLLCEIVSDGELVNGAPISVIKRPAQA
ncbi:MAG: hypothetical protein H6888_09850 [Nitratireductor sp.]|nr:hypothetical protein [Nitratireductor sp.]MCC0021362.1 hypothetical protein [Nitratireductor sp.]